MKRFLLVLAHFFLESVSSKAVNELNVRLGERDWSLALGVSERKMEVFDLKA